MAKGKVGRHTKYSKAMIKKAETYAGSGLNNMEIANNLGISKTSLYEYMVMYTELADAIKNGRAKIIVPILENALIQQALGGQTFTETTTERDKDGNITSTKTVNKVMLPNTSAQIFGLKNYAPDKWADRHEVDHKGEIGTKLIIEFVDPKKDGK